MSHEITVRENGFAEIAVVGNAPWHKLGQNVAPEDARNIPNFIEKSGTGWLALKKPIVGDDGRSLKDWGYEVRRSDNNQTIGLIGPNTHLLQNHEAFNWFQPCVDSGEVQLETAGSLQGGSKVWVMGRLNSVSEIVKGDEILHYILLSNSHDGTQAVRVGFTPIRVVCANTLAIAKNCNSSKLVKVRHSKDVLKNLEAIRDVMNFAKASFEATEKQFQFLANKNINASDLRKYVKLVFDVKDEDGKVATRTENKIQEILTLHENKTGMLSALRLKEIEEARQASISTAAANLLASIEENFEDGRGTDNAPSRGTWWTAYNAVTEHLSHNAGRSDETRYNSIWFGEGFKTNQKALELATELASV